MVSIAKISKQSFILVHNLSKWYLKMLKTSIYLINIQEILVLFSIDYNLIILLDKFQFFLYIQGERLLNKLCFKLNISYYV
jgi:hypothetical protein